MVQAKYIGILAFILFLCSCQGSGGGRTEQDNSLDTLMVRIAIAKDSSFADTLRLRGSLLPFREANLGVAIPGRVEQVLSPKGSKVRKGDLLVLLSNEMLLQKEAELQAVKKDYDRIKELYAEGSVSRQEYDHLLAKYQSAKAERAMFKKNTRIIAPFSGVVADIITNEHENYALNPFLSTTYSSTSGIIKLMQTDTLLVNFSLHENFLHAIRNKKYLHVRVPAVSEESLVLRVKRVSDYLSTNYRMAEVELLLPNSAQHYHAGMSCHVLLDLPKQDAVAIPLDAMMRLPGSNEDFVLVLESPSYRQQRIDILYVGEDAVFVSGVSPQDTLITEGKLNVRKDRLLIVKQ